MTGIIRINDFIIIKMPSSNMKIVQLIPQTTVDLGKFGSFRVEALVGKPINAEYEIVGDLDVQLKVLQKIEVEADSDADNSNLLDCPTSQQLTHMEIEQLKEDTLKGKIDDTQLIRKLVDNSKTFENKTGFAKEKYIKRKQRKFSKSFYAMETSAFNLCGLFFLQKPIKINELRTDTLSQMMSLGNVFSGSKYIVVDGIKGLLAGAVMERLGGKGLVINVGAEQADIDIYKKMNFGDVNAEDSICLNVGFSQIIKDGETVKNAKTQEALETLRTTKLDGLLVASQYNPQEVIELLSPYLEYSRPIVIYSVYKESLIPSFLYLRATSGFINTQMSESWIREYQISSNASGSHPLMQMSGGGGYLLSTLYVESGSD
ncbi:Gcd10p family-domain-containing protein [Chytridium lagenaria]|nr:Gcd10p family-domain-containing protein [Chytridium lagenaria]